MASDRAYQEWLATLKPSDRIVFSQPVPAEAFRAGYERREGAPPTEGLREER